MEYELIKGADFNYYVYKNRVEKIIFTDEKAPKRAQLKIVQNRVQLNRVQLTDLSNDRDGSIVGWLEDDGVYKVSTQKKGQKIIFNEDCSGMFYGGEFCCDDIELSKRNESEMKEVCFNNVDTSHVTNMGSMFDHCKQLIKLDLSNFDTSNVTIMHSMFEGCSKLEHLDLSTFDTQNVVDMSEMFSCCRNLKELDLSSFDTSNVMSMFQMFDGCKQLKSLDLSRFNTYKVKTMAWMLAFCMNLESLKLNKCKLHNAVNLDGIFAGCDKFTSLETTDVQLKNEYQKKVIQKQNKMYSNIDLNNLKINDGKEMQKEKSIDKE